MDKILCLTSYDKENDVYFKSNYKVSQIQRCARVMAKDAKFTKIVLFYSDIGKTTTNYVTETPEEIAKMANR